MKCIRAVVLSLLSLLPLAGEVAAAEAVGTGTASAEAVGTGIGGVQTQGQVTSTSVIGDTVTVEGQAVVTPLYPAPLPGTALNVNPGLPTEVRALPAFLGAKGQCKAASYRQFRGEIIREAGASGATEIVLFKFAEQQKREAENPATLLDVVDQAELSDAPIRNVECAAFVMVISVKGKKLPDPMTMEDDVDNVLFKYVKGFQKGRKLTLMDSVGTPMTIVVDASGWNVGTGQGGLKNLLAWVINAGYSSGKGKTEGEFIVGYSSLVMALEQPKGVSIYPAQLRLAFHRELVSTKPPAQKPQAEKQNAPPPQASAEAAVIATAPADTETE